MSSLLLGPSEWGECPHTPVPLWVTAWLHEHDAAPAHGGPSPLQVRRSFAAFLRAQGLTVAVMEEWPGPSDRVQMRLFRTIVGESKVNRFLLYWPKGGRLLGLTAEVEYLTNCILEQTLTPTAVHLLPEEGVVDRGEEGSVVMLEKKNRTRYHADLYELGCPYHIWSSYNELQVLLRSVAAE
jgi:hypothetical protein